MPKRTLQRVEHTENRKSLQAMVRAIDESSRAAGQLLDHAMVTFRAESLELSRIALADLLRDLVQSMSPVAEMKDISIVMELDGPAALTRRCDLASKRASQSYRQCSEIWRLLRRLSPCVSLRHHVMSVSIMDEGTGFAADEMQTLTGRFVRGKDMGNKFGSGLGLTIAHEVAIAHGGEMILTNTAEGGACVTLYF